MRQTWHDLLFAHWRVDAHQLRARVPQAFPLDLFDGDAFVGVVPFRMTNVAPRGVPALPGISEFPEINVRTYVRVGDKPGVFFFSLDAANALAVRVARLVLNLPYFKAAMSITPVEQGFAYRSRRDGGAEFAATYGPSGEPFSPIPRSLEHFLTERYCLYNMDRRGRPYRLDIHHPPWTLQAAEAEITSNTLADAGGVTLPGQPPVLHFAARQDMVAWGPTWL